MAYRRVEYSNESSLRVRLMNWYSTGIPYMRKLGRGITYVLDINGEGDVTRNTVGFATPADNCNCYLIISGRAILKKGVGMVMRTQHY
jgi:hypothetical protein